jgi:hypothetical protein
VGIWWSTLLAFWILSRLAYTRGVVDATAIPERTTTIVKLIADLIVIVAAAFAFAMVRSVRNDQDRWLAASPVSEPGPSGPSPV